MPNFIPTLASNPPPDVRLRLKEPPTSLPNYHALVSLPRLRSSSRLSMLTRRTQNPLIFILRAAQIYPDKVALVHTDVEHPVVYTFAIW